MAKPTKQLLKTWYAKLKKDGFKDIEQDEDNLKVWSNVFIRPDANVKNRNDYNARPKSVRQKKDEFEAKRDYYYYAEHFLTNHKFQSERERIIWEYHVHGVSARNTSKLLEKVKINISKSAVNDVVKKLQIIMKDQLK